MSFAENLIELRKYNNLSQEELAEKLEISQRSLSKIETGRNFLTAETLEKLLTAFNMTPSELFEFEHLSPQEVLVDEIYQYIDSIKDDNSALTILYKITKSLTKK